MLHTTAHDAASTASDADYDALLEMIVAPTDGPACLLQDGDALGSSVASAPLSLLHDDDETDELTAKDLDAMLSLVDEDGGAFHVAAADGIVGAALPLNADPTLMDVGTRDGEGGGRRQQVRARTNHRSSTSRTRQKQELAYLRAQVVELEAELERMKHTWTGSRTSTSSEENDSREPSVWEKIAKRQAEEKHRAGVENIKLRGLVEGQLRIAQSLERLLRKRAPSESESLFMERKRARTIEEQDDAALYAAIRSRIMHQFDDVERVMNECGLASRTSDLDDSRAMCDADGSICMEMAMVKVLPFDFAKVAEAVWQCSSAREITLENGFYGTVCRTETDCNLQFTLTLRMRRSKATINVKGVGARRMTADRSMIVLEMVGRTEGPIFANHRIVCRERGYILIERDAASATPSTIVRTCVRLRPEAEQLEDEGTACPQIGLFVDLVIGSYNQNTKTMMQYIENLLLASMD